SVANGAGAPMQPLTARTTGDGIRLRLFVTPLPAPAPLPQPGIPPEKLAAEKAATLPAHCRPSSVLDVELSDDAAIGRASAPLWPDAPTTAPISLASMAFTGLAEGSPVFTVI